MRQTKPIATCVLLLAFISGCAKDVPKCSDDRTLSLIQQIVIKEFGGSQGVTEKELHESMRIEFPRASAYDEKIKKYQCQAKLVGGIVQLPINYESQLDDKDIHIATLIGTSNKQLEALQFAVVTAVLENRKTNIADTAPNPQPMSFKITPNDIPGRWVGPTDSDPEMTINSKGNGFDVDLTAHSPYHCTGSVDGPAVLAGNALTLTKKIEDQVCTITVTFLLGVANVNQNGCSYFHGGACDFIGKVKRQH